MVNKIKIVNKGEFENNSDKSLSMDKKIASVQEFINNQKLNPSQSQGADSDVNPVPNREHGQNVAEETSEQVKNNNKITHIQEVDQEIPNDETVQGETKFISDTLASNQEPFDSRIDFSDKQFDSSMEAKPQTTPSYTSSSTNFNSGPESYMMLADNTKTSTFYSTEKAVSGSSSSKILPTGYFDLASNHQQSAPLEFASLQNNSPFLFKLQSVPQIAFHATVAPAQVLFGNVFTGIIEQVSGAITGIFTSTEKPVVKTVTIAGGDPNAFDPTATQPFSVQIVPVIEHEAIASRSSALFGNKLALSDGNNHFFVISQPALHAVHDNAVETISLTGSAAGIVDNRYVMRTSGANVVTLSNGTTTSPGSLLLNPAANSVVNPEPGNFDLTFAQNAGLRLYESVDVTSSILAKVNIPAGAANTYNIISGSNVNILSITDYSANSTISSLIVGENLGKMGHSLIINASNNYAIIAYSVSPGQGLLYIDSTGKLKGLGLFGVLSNYGAAIDKGIYDYISVADANHDTSSDLLFGNNEANGAMLLYGTFAQLGPNGSQTPLMPKDFSLANLPAVLSATTFIVPDHQVGTAIATGTTPIDGGAALNALYNTQSGVNFVGDTNGDGHQDLIISRHSTDYADDSDLTYVIYGQSGKFPVNVEMLPFGDVRLKSGIVGQGLDSNGAVVQDVKGFTITGEIADPRSGGTIVPNSFSVKSIGDFNADGFSDLFALSNNNTGYVIFGHPSLLTEGSNINLGTASPFVYKLFTLPSVASSTQVPTIDDFKGSPIDGDGFSDLFFSSAVGSTSLTNQTIPLAKYITAFTSNSGVELGGILSGAVLTDGSLNANPFGSAYAFLTSPGHYDTSHIILGLNNQATLDGYSGIDNIIGGTGNQTLYSHGAGTTHANLPGVIGSTLIGGDGNNIFQIQDPVFHKISAGTGFDILRLNSGVLDLAHLPNPTAIDLASRASQIVLGIERIELGNDAGLVLNAEAILNMTSYKAGAGSYNGTQFPGVAANGNPIQGAAALLVASLTGGAKDPLHAPTVTFVNDAEHQWNVTAVNTTRYDGQLATPVTLTAISQAFNNTMSTVLVEANVNIQVVSG
ncbi:MAG: hypothetical protein H0W64_09240 [Gammaproteobacteria bacterium]|nr:hypothetical protein [Gammaproteobacteria bacterium]